MLTATGIAGKPDSYFFGTSLEEWLKDLNLVSAETAREQEVLEAVFKAARFAGRNGTDLFGLRMQAHSFDFFREKLAVLYSEFRDDRDRIARAFGNTLFVHLTRHDKIAQAVSYVKARQTGLWHLAADGSELERLGPRRTPRYVRDHIETCIETLKAYDCDWNNWFDRENIDPVRISYDALSADPTATLRRVLKSLGLDPAVADGVTPGTAKMADATDKAWQALFLFERGGP